MMRLGADLSNDHAESYPHAADTRLSPISPGLTEVSLLPVDRGQGGSIAGLLVSLLYINTGSVLSWNNGTQALADRSISTVNDGYLDRTRRSVVERSSASPKIVARIGSPRCISVDDAAIPSRGLDVTRVLQHLCLLLRKQRRSSRLAGHTHQGRSRTTRCITRRRPDL
jgi:hypothetical protein